MQNSDTPILKPLWDHQKKAIEKARIRQNLAIFFEVGTGKTRTVIEILRERCNEARRMLRTLVLAPIVANVQWKNEILKFSKIKPEDITILSGMSGKKREALLENTAKSRPNSVVITNYEALLMEGVRQKLMEWEPEVLIVDESHMIKNPSSYRTKRLIPIADKARHTYLLTGTPVLNTPLDLFSQYRVMDKGETFGQNFFVFRVLYFYDANAHMPRHNYFPNWKIRKDSVEKFQAILERTACQAKKDECLDLPDLLEIPVEVSMGKEQLIAYDEMKKTFITQVKDKIIPAQLAIVQTIRLQQILAGFIQDKGSMDKAYYYAENPRLDATIEKVEEIVESGEKVIIWSNFEPTYFMIRDRLSKLKIDSMFITGNESHKEKQASIDAFTKSSLPVVICNPQAAGISVNLIEAKYAIFYTRSYSLAHYTQSKARNYRGGSEIHDKITHYHMVAPKTLDEVIFKAILNKQELADTLLSWVNE